MNGKSGISGVSTRRRVRPPLVLVVDDFPDTREMYAEVLALAGFRVAEAENGAEAIERAKELRPAVIVMDLSLPVIDGWEATRRIKGDPVAGAARIVAISAHSLEMHVARALQAGAEGFIAKPCLPDELVNAVRRLVQTALTA